MMIMQIRHLRISNRITDENATSDGTQLFAAGALYIFYIYISMEGRAERFKFIRNYKDSNFFDDVVKPY